MGLDNQEIKYFKIETEKDFKLAVSYFTSRKKEERLALYKEIATEKNIDEPTAKNELLSKLFGDYIDNSLKQALNYAEVGEAEKAYDLIKPLSLIKPIFKDYDINSYDSFILSGNSNISPLELNFLLKEPSLNQYDLNNIVEVLIKTLSKKANPINDKDDLVDVILAHPMLPCLDAFNDEKITIKNIEDGVIELGEYKALVLEVLKLKNELGKESYHSLIFFIINEDVKHEGLSNLLNSENYKPKEFQKLLNNLVGGKKIHAEHINDVMDKVQNDHNTNYAINIVTNILEKRKSSKMSLNDSGYEYVFPNGNKVFNHIHTDAHHGLMQNGQHATTCNILNNKGMDTIGITVLSDLIFQKHHKEFLHGFIEKYDLLNKFSEREMILLTGLQFKSELVTVLAGKLPTPVLSDSYMLSSNFVLVEESIHNSIDLVKKSTRKSDLINLLEFKDSLFNIIRKEPEFFKDCLSHTSTNNSNLYQLVAKPILLTIQEMFKLEARTMQKLFTPEDLELVKDLISNKNTYNNPELSSFRVSIELFRDNVIRNIPQNLFTPYPNINTTEFSEFIAEKTINKEEASSHLEAVKNLKCDFLDYFIKNPLNRNEFKNEELVELKASLRGRILNDLDDLVKSPRLDDKKKIIECIDSILTRFDNKFTAGFCPGDYSNRNVATRTLARLAINHKQNNTSIPKSKDKLESDTRILNMLSLYAQINGTKITCYENYSEKKINFNEKIKVKVI